VQQAQYIKTMLKPVSNRKSVLACSADCPTDNNARPLALVLYETLAPIKTEQKQQIGKNVVKMSQTNRYQNDIFISSFDRTLNQN